MDEGENLRKQIKFLTDLINSANKNSKYMSSKKAASISAPKSNIYPSSAAVKQNSTKNSQFVWKKDTSVNDSNSGQNQNTSASLPRAKFPVSGSKSSLYQHSKPSVQSCSFVTSDVGSKKSISKNLNTFHQKCVSNCTGETTLQGNLHVPRSENDAIQGRGNLTVTRNSKYKLDKSAHARSPVSIISKNSRFNLSSEDKREKKTSTSQTETLQDDSSSDKQSSSTTLENNSAQFEKLVKIISPAASPSKKEAVELLNKKLSATSDKIEQVKKSLSFNVQATERSDEVPNTSLLQKKSSRFKYEKPSCAKQQLNSKSSVRLDSHIRKTRFKYQKVNKNWGSAKDTQHVLPSMVGNRSKLQTGCHGTSGTQVLANVIKSKYKLRKTNFSWNTLNNSTLNATTRTARLSINMKNFYKKMAKKYGWSDLDFKKSGHNVKKKILHHRRSFRPFVKSRPGYSVNRGHSHKTKLPHASRLKLDRRKVAPRPVISRSKKGTHFVLRNGVLYKSNHTSMIKTSINPNFGSHRSHKVQSSKIKAKIQNFTLKRKSKYIFIKHTTSQFDADSTRRSYNARILASKAINKSIATATAKYRKDNTKKKGKKYCIFYNRFGKCNRGDNCPYIHDPERIAICTRFLRGTCRDPNCPFSHKLAKEKMPVCSYFLKGVCNRDDCPYLHVNVSKDAGVCPDFLEGFCPLGEKCKKKHTRICEEFATSGTCSKGEKCTLIHTQRGRRKKRSSSALTQRDDVSTSATDSSSISNKRHFESQEVDDPSIPFKHRKLPAFISLNSSSAPDDVEEKADSAEQFIVESVRKENDKGIQIKPKL